MHDKQNSLSEEGRVIFALLMEKLDSIVGELRGKSERLEMIEEENVKLKAKLIAMKNRLDSLETRDLCNNLKVSGPSLSTSGEGNTILATISLFKQKMQCELNPDQVISAYRVSSKSLSQATDSREIMIRFRDRRDRYDLLLACKRVKPSDLYVNDDLTPFRSNILFTLR